MKTAHCTSLWLQTMARVGPIACLALTTLTSACDRPSRNDAVKVAPAKAHTEKGSGGEVREIAGAHTGVGWSVSPSTDVAVAEALSHAELDNKPDLLVAFYTPQHQPDRILSAVRAKVGAGPRVIGMSSHEGVLTSEGFHTSPDGVVGVLSMRVPGMVAGVGGASFDEAPGGESARLAYRRALQDAGNPPGKPSMVLVFTTFASEEEMLAALTDEIGPDVPLVGGTAAGRVADLAAKRDFLAWTMIAGDKAMSKGAAVALLYTQHPFAYAYAGGFSRVTTRHGVITAADRRLIRAIDDRPAFDVYDEWHGGRAKEANARGEKMQFMASYPVVKDVSRNGLSQYQFVSVYPSDSVPDALTTETNVAVGDVLYPSEGSWNILLNRFAALPRAARKSATSMTPIAGLFLYCGGALNVIPNDQRGNMGYLVSQDIGDLPWIGGFSWGEQGHIQGIGNLHGNLMASTLLFPAEGASGM
jgi:hypothetical protein